MAPITQPRLSLREKSGLAFLLLFIAPTQITVNLIRIVFLAAKRGSLSRFFVTCALIRTFLGRFSARQIQYLSPPTNQVYQTWIAQKRAKAKRLNDSFAVERLQCDIELLPDRESSIQWVGDRRKATKFVLFFHGGGYVAPLSPGHLEWCWHSYVKAGEVAGVDVAVAVLQYTLCPSARYPVQLRQATAALAHLLESGIHSADIIIGGDSAGGNLTGQVLSHLLHPHPEVQLLELTEQLGGAFTVSPWLSARTDSPSFIKNQYIDMLSPAIVATFVQQLLSGGNYQSENEEGKGWAMPVDVDESWFDGMSTVINHLYVTVGEQEVLKDQGISFAEGMRRRNPGMVVRLELLENEAHDFIFLEGQAEIVGDAMSRMKAWVTELWGNGE